MRQRTWWRTGAVALVSAFAALLVCEGALRLAGREPLPPPPESPLFEVDEELGWRKRIGRRLVGSPIPGASPLVSTVWPDGSRATATEPVVSERCVVLIGCSWTQGMEVTDEDSLGWKLQTLRPDLSVRNHGTGGYGTVGALVSLRSVLRAAHADTVVYGYIPSHEQRNVLSAEWTDNLERGADRSFQSPPFGVLRDGKLRITQEWIALWPGARTFATVHTAEQAWRTWHSAARVKNHQEVTRQALLEMNRLVTDQGGRFLVALLEAPKGTGTGNSLGLSGTSVHVVDCSFPLDPSLVSGSHPNGTAHGRFAACISVALEARP